MKLETKKILATIENIIKDGLEFMIPCHEDGGTFNPYLWDSEQQSTFSPLSLIKAEGWIQEIDIKEAIKNWQWSEKTGLAAEGILDPYGMKDSDNLDKIEPFINEDTQLARAEIYHNIFEFLSTKVHDLQAFSLSCDFNYSLSVVVGKISEQQWITICPIVPQETSPYFNEEIICSSFNREQSTSEFIHQSDIAIAIKKYINQLASINIYGWYDGGYNNIHEYKIIHATGTSQELAIENALFKSGLLEIYKFESFNILEQLECYDAEEAQEIKIRSNHLNDFLKQTFSELLLYRFCFWDYEHIYILGQTTSKDKVGIDLHSQFTYNP